MRHLFVKVFFIFYYLLPTSAFYGEPTVSNGITTRVSGTFVAIENKIYALGGRRFQGKPMNLYDVMVLNFSPNNTMHAEILSGDENTSVECSNCQGFLLPDKKTIVVVGVTYVLSNSNATFGLGFYNTTNNSWSIVDALRYTDDLPTPKVGPASVISEKGDVIYSFGGFQLPAFANYDIIPPYGVIKYDLVNRTSVIDMSLEHPNLRLDVIFSCANMLPNGKIVIAFGYNHNGDFYNSSQVFIFDTNTNVISVQPITGKPPPVRVSAASVLGPDKKTIYYFGGRDPENRRNPDKGIIFNDVPMLDTETWSWIEYSIPGLASVSLTDASMTVFGSDKIVISTGAAFSFYSKDIAVLANVPGVGEDIQSSGLRWFTNNEYYDNPPQKSHLSDGGKAGIAVAVIVFVALILGLLYKYVPATRRVATYVQQDLIWSPRSGEPLWAETTRLLVRFILLVLFLAFVSYVIYRSIDSPIATQRIDKITNSVLSPDIRFCFDGFNSSAIDASNEDPSVSCNFRNGTSCTSYIIPLDGTIHNPKYTDNFGNVSCFLFLPGPDFRIVDSGEGYSDSAGAKMVFTLFATPLYANNTNWGVVYIDFYAPGFDPNVKVFGFPGDTNYNEDEIQNWQISEQAFNLVNSIILKQGVISTASYILTKNQKLRTDDGWNYIGFSSSYIETMTVENKYKDAPPSAKNMVPETSYISQITIQPDAFVEITLKEQKVFTLLNALAQAGGVLGLFIAVQTLLFGFRPQSPWGIVHRWSFGRLRIRLTDRLAQYFNKTGTPVPLVNPVNNDPNLHQYFKDRNNTYVPHGPDVPSACDDQIETTVVQENRVKRVEERLQLMELLLKSYYLNDEVFRSLDQAVKRNNEEKRRSSIVPLNDLDTDSVLGNDALNEGYNGDRIDDTNVKRRPSSTVFEMRQRGQYQPNLTPEAPSELYDEENEIGKR